MKHIKIYKCKNSYSTFPSIARINDLHLMLSFRVAGQISLEASKKDITTHHSPDSKIATIESFDNGKTWNQDSFKIVYSEEGVSVNDPGITVLHDGSIILRFTKIKTHEIGQINYKVLNIVSYRQEHKLLSSAMGHYFIKTSDNGKNWLEPVLMDFGNNTYSFSREPIVELSDNSMVISFYSGAPRRTDESFISHSFDRGTTWQDPYTIFSDEKGSKSQDHGINFNETALLPLKNGKMLAVARADNNFTDENGNFMQVGGVGKLYSSHSDNGGLSWNPPKKTSLWGQPPHLLRINKNLIMCTYGYRKKPYEVKAAFSSDDGLSWDDEIIIRSGASGWDIGYPSSIMLSKTKILTTYYFYEDDLIRYISGTIWEI